MVASRRGGALKPVQAFEMKAGQTPMKVTVGKSREGSGAGPMASAATRNRQFQPIIVTKAQQARAESARKLHDCMGHPSTKRLIESVQGGKITNCPLTAIDIRRAEDIFGRCRSCEAARASAPQARPSESQPAERVGERVHVDILFTKGKGEKKQNVLISVDE